MVGINEKTMIPIGLAVLVIGGGAGWMTRQEIKTTANSEQIIQVNEKVENLDKILNEIEKRLAGIEGELKRIRR